MTEVPHEITASNEVRLHRSSLPKIIREAAADSQYESSPEIFVVNGETGVIELAGNVRR
jgi:hypothetical protein